MRESLDESAKARQVDGVGVWLSLSVVDIALRLWKV